MDTSALNSVSLNPKSARRHCKSLLAAINSTGIFEWSERDLFYEVLKKWELSFLLFDGPELVGGCICSEKHSGLFVNILFVDRIHHGKGVGKRLVRELLQTAAAHVYDRICLKVRKENRAAFELYRAEGFHVEADEEDQFIMVKNLSNWTAVEA